MAVVWVDVAAVAVPEAVVALPLVDRWATIKAVVDNAVADVVLKAVVAPGCGEAETQSREWRRLRDSTFADFAQRPEALRLKVLSYP